MPAKLYALVAGESLLTKSKRQLKLSQTHVLGNSGYLPIHEVS